MGNDLSAALTRRAGAIMLNRDTTMRLRILGFAGAVFGLSGCPDDGADDDAPVEATTDEGGESTLDGAMTATTSNADTAGDTDGSGDATTSDSGTTSDMDTGTDGTDGTDETGTTGVEDCTVVLAEIVFDPQGDDDEQQWIKLKNLCSYDIDLATWTIGYAGEHYGDNRQKQLDGDGVVDTIIPGFGCYLVGGPTTAAANGMPVYDWPDDFAPGLSYSADIGSGVALFDLPKGMVDETTIPVDAVVYGPNNDAGLIDPTGNAVPAPHVGLPPEGGSITRTSAEATWDLTVSPLAGTCPVF